MNGEIVEAVRRAKPLIHCMTNYVTSNDVANMILAAGASPIMAESSCEAEEITAICQGLVLNIGMLTKEKLDAMIVAGKKAAALGHIVVIDPVGAGASSFRAGAVRLLLNEVPCSVIRGNRSEIAQVLKLTECAKGQADCGNDSCYGKRGVDAAPDEGGPDEPEEWRERLLGLSRRTKAVIVMTGKTDLVADSGRLYRIHDGHSMMSRITGAGCMLDGVIAAYGAAWQSERLRQPFGEAVALAVAAMGLCGELAYEKVRGRQEGTGSFRSYLLDFMSRLDGRQLMGGNSIEIQTIISDPVRGD